MQYFTGQLHWYGIYNSLSFYKFCGSKYTRSKWFKVPINHTCVLGDSMLPKPDTFPDIPSDVSSDIPTD